MTFRYEEYPELTFNEEHQGPSLVCVVSIVTGSSPKLPALIKAHVLLIIVSCSKPGGNQGISMDYESPVWSVRRMLCWHGHSTLCLEMIDTFYTFIFLFLK